MRGRNTAVKVLSPGTQPDFRLQVRISICLDLRHWEIKSPKLPGMGMSFVLSIEVFCCGFFFFFVFYVSFGDLKMTLTKCVMYIHLNVATLLN